MKLTNPKQQRAGKGANWYRYYAGYSPEFVRDALEAVEGRRRRLAVLDPWVGAGTTTAIAALRGHSGVGVDINPALVVVAKARLLGSDVEKSLHALTEEIVACARTELAPLQGHEPLEAWFVPRAARVLRGLERSITRILVAPSSDERRPTVDLEAISPLAAFFYSALFRAVRERLRSARSSNPTWIKASLPTGKRARPSEETAYLAFRQSVETFRQHLKAESLASEAARSFRILHGSSTSLNLPDQCFDVVISSPPYCTRIDYVANVRPELALLGYGDESLMALRHHSLGSPLTLPGFVADVDADSRTARKFLREVQSHPSKASSGYYHRFFLNYFGMLGASLREMHRVARRGARAFIVLQDSHYKEIHLDLAGVSIELAARQGWKLVNRLDNRVGRTFAAVNPQARAHRDDFSATESIVVLKKP